MTMPVISALDFTRWVDERIPQDTPMRNFYNGKVVFLTGGTGALGQIFIEKLLRCRVKLLYIMVRDKNNKSATERLDAILASPLYTKCKESTPRFSDRIRLVSGDLQHLDAAISAADRSELLEHVQIVIHAGGAVRADASLADVGRINVRGTREILRLAHEMQHLEAFAYISSAFSHCYRNDVPEEFMPAPLDPDDMIRMVEHDESVAVLDAVSQRLRYPWPNNFTFSTAITEEQMRRAGKTMPITVMRPSMVLSTHEDPITGYNTSTYGINGVMVAFSMGLMRVAAANAKCRSHIICSDFVVSATLSAVWDLCVATGDEATIKEVPKIYTVTVNQDELRWGDMNKQILDHNKEAPLMKTIWLPKMHLMPCRYQVAMFSLLYELLPHMLMDILLAISGCKFRILPHYKLVVLGRDNLKHFVLNDWNLACSNIKTLYSTRLHKSDQAFFPCDLELFHWKDFSYKYALGVKSYVLKENLNNVEDAKSKQLKMKVAHFGVLLAYYLGWAVFWYVTFRCSGAVHALYKWCPYYV